MINLTGTIERGSINGVKEFFEAFIGVAREKMRNAGQREPARSYTADGVATTANTPVITGHKAKEPKADVEPIVGQKATNSSNPSVLGHSKGTDKAKHRIFVCVVVGILCAVMLASLCYFYTGSSDDDGHDNHSSFKSQQLSCDAAHNNIMNNHRHHHHHHIASNDHSVGNDMRLLVDAWRRDLDNIQQHLQQIQAMTNRLNQDMSKMMMRDDDA